MITPQWAIIEIHSDQVIKIHSLNIERAWRFKLSVKFWTRYTEQFRKNSLWKTRNSTKNAWLNWRFYHTANWWFSIASMSFDSACKEKKIALIAQIIINLNSYIRRCFYGLSRMKEEKCQQWRQQRFAYWILLSDAHGGQALSLNISASLVVWLRNVPLVIRCGTEDFNLVSVLIFIDKLPTKWNFCLLCCWFSPFVSS